MSEKNKINLDEFKKEIFKNIAPMGIKSTREKLIEIVDELKESREEIANLKSLLGGTKVPRGKLEEWLSDALAAMGKINLLELNVARSRIELGMKSLGMTLPGRKE